MNFRHFKHSHKVLLDQRSYRSAVIGFLFIAAVLMILWHPIDHAEGLDAHPDCPLCQMMGGTALVPDLAPWLLILVLFVFKSQVLPLKNDFYFPLLFFVVKESRAPPAA